MEKIKIMETKFIGLFKEALEFEDKDIQLDDKFREYPEWDSLSRLSLIAMLDDEFDIQIEDDVFKTLITVGDLVEFLKKHQ
jgi:acyl carrier protein